MPEDRRVTRSARHALALPVVLFLLVSCSSDAGGAAVACETFVNQRVGAQLQHRTPAEGETVEGDGPFVVHGAFTELAARKVTTYTCTVEKTDNGWHLADLKTDR
jgi:hypothetical protein